MYELSIRGHFDAAHALHGYPGECAGLHGHTWDIEVAVRGESLDDVGIVYDFKRLKADLEAVVAPLDHAYLNEVPPFDVTNPTAENLAKYIYNTLTEEIGGKITVTEVSVWESPVARITYRP
ncbi:MAG: 6-carboxytetrahydropterin synthase QueD [Coriobacteriia bacterium]|nr:6-carboxytetrahydropterin synthase QueD [Coriobacteriia bacterium]